LALLRNVKLYQSEPNLYDSPLGAAVTKIADYENKGMNSSPYNNAMRGALFLSLFAATLSGQTASPPPAGVDGALRARVTAFYDLLVKHQFRRAEELVAPDSRDIYYDREKPRFISYELTSIAYSEDFTSAKVVVAIKMPPAGAMMPGILNVPVESPWILLDGAWYWSIPKINVTDLLKSMSAGETSNAAPNLPGGMGRPEAIPGAGTGENAGVPHFSMDRTEVVLSGSATGKVAITNTSSAPMTLFLLGKIPGIEARFDQPAIKPGEKAVLSIQAGAGAKDGMLLIGVAETKAMMPLPITVK
jgi:hypothetical protein